MDKLRKELAGTPMLFPYDPERFWKRLRKIIKKEFTVLKNSMDEENIQAHQFEESKPLNT